MNEQTIFTAAIERIAAERAAFLDGACGTDHALRERVEKLIALHEHAGSFLDRPAAGADATLDLFSERPGTIIGPYKLLQQIGEGGMGTVFMAEQTQPVKRMVALKVIKPGMDSRQIIARFEAERQALAMMDHVNIARVFDGGTIQNEPRPSGSAPAEALPDGRGSSRPYFVMELVHGVPITKYCDDNHLTPRERLELFVPVCQAIQHAHQKGIIHRDIKPSNVMVTLYDGKPVPKVIDFGVAKATEQKLTERTLFTLYGTMVGTLEYMSPEQAEMSALGVDTRSDIYSLGVLLYELLTGSTPLTHKRMKEAAYAEILRMIKEEEPPKPSTRLSDSGEALASISANRHTEPAKLTKLVKGELDWIVMKTLEKDRNRRYETAKDCAADVQRYLDDEQVQACPPSAGYRLRKFARRNRAAMLTATVVSAALLLGTVVSTWQAVRATRAEGLAETRLRAETVAKLVSDQQRERAEGNLRLALQALDEVYLGSIGYMLPRQEQGGALDRGLLMKGLAFYQQFADQNSDQPNVRFETARAYVRVGGIQGQLGRFDKAELAYRQGLALFEKLTTEQPANAEYRFALANGLNSLGCGLVEVGRGPDAEEAFKQAIARLEELAAASPSEHRYGHSAGRAHYNLGNWLSGAGRVKDAEAHHRRSLALWEKLSEEGYNPLTCRDGLGMSYIGLSSVFRRLGRVKEEEEALRNAVDLYEQVVTTKESPYYRAQLANAHRSLGGLLANSDRVAQAEQAYRRAVQLNEQIVSDVPASPQYREPLALSQFSLGMLLQRTGRLDEAVAVYRKAIELDPKHAKAHAGLGTVLLNQEKLEEAVASFKKALELDPKLAPAHYNLGVALEKQGKRGEAMGCYRKVIEIDPKFAPAHQKLGIFLSREGKEQEASAFYKRAIELDPNNATYHLNFGLNLYKQRKLGEAIALLRRAIELDPKYAKAHGQLGLALTDQGMLDEAITFCQRATELDPKNVSDLFNLGRALQAKGRLDEAVACFRKTIDLDPKLASAHSMLGLALMNQGKLDEAIAWYCKAIDLDPNSAVTHSNLGIALTNQGKVEEAIVRYQKAIELDPKLATAHNNLGAALNKQGKPDHAIVWFRKAIELDSKNAAARINLVETLNHRAWQLATSADSKDRAPRRAVELAKEAVDLVPREGRFWNTLGVALYREGEWKAAVEAFQKSMDLRKGGDANDWFFLAMAHWQLGDKEEARKWHDRAVEWMEKNAKENEELQRFRKEAEELLEVQK